MRNIKTLLLFLALFTARWDTNISASISWHAESRSCLYVTHRTGERAFIGCWEKAGTYFVEIGHGLTDGTVRPAAGDVYVLQSGGQTYSADLVARPVYLPTLLH